jgi:RNA recognition motif-containing protein
VCGDLFIIEINCRGFGFITFKDPESVEKVLNVHTEQPICIDEKTVSFSLSPSLFLPPSLSFSLPHSFSFSLSPNL